MARSFAHLLICSFTLICFATTSEAHHPDRECQTVRPRVDVIGPLGNNLRPSYRRELNRPRFLGGKLAYKIAPTSQEAMAWHRAEHQGAYSNEACRIEPRYFYPKPWEALNIGPRRSTDSESVAGLQPLADGELVPLMPKTDFDLKDESTDSFALSDGESSIVDIDTPAPDKDEVLPEPPSSPSDIVPDSELEVEANNVIGSGLRKAKDQLKISSPQ